MRAFICEYRRVLIGKIAFVAFVLLSVAPSQAVVIIGNSLAGSDDGSLSGPPGSQLAAGFTMPGQDYTLTDVVLRLLAYSGPGDAAVSIYSDSAGFPGSALVTLLDPAAGGSPANYAFTPPAGPPTILLANTSYWLVVAVEPGGNFGWVTASDAPVGVATLDGYAQNLGSGWEEFALPP